MSAPILETKGFAASVIDALSSHICVIDQTGMIVTVNRAWKDFAVRNPPVSNSTGVGSHYLGVCRSATGPGSEDAEEFALGVQSVLDGKSDLFEMEYPCHSPTENRWFSGHVTPLKNNQNGAVISHVMITDRKLLEFELIKLASTDSLTGLPNRRYFVETANREVERANRFGSAASVIMIDLDHFKAVNDTHGHATGDDALNCLAKVCKLPLRQMDVFARIGGEEFAVMLPGTDEGGAAHVAEKLRRAVCGALVESKNGPFSMTASFGVASIQAGDKDIAESLGRADIALYAAKHGGRNRVMRHSEISGASQN